MDRTHIQRFDLSEVSIEIIANVANRFASYLEIAQTSRASYELAIEGEDLAAMKELCSLLSLSSTIKPSRAHARNRGRRLL